MQNPCLLQVTGYTERQPGVYFNNMMNISLQTPGPIAVGEYSVKAYAKSSGIASDILPPNQANAGVMLTNMPEGMNDLQFETGTLVIKHLSRHLVAGHISGVANHREYSTQTGNDEITETRSLAVKFSIRTEGISVTNPGGDYACIERKKKPE